MSAKGLPLEHVLAEKDAVIPDLDGMTTDILKQAARFWFGTTAANKFRKAECIQALDGLFRDRMRLQEGLRSLPEKQRQILMVCKRYSGAMSGPLLLTEALTRGLVEKPKDHGFTYGRRRQDEDPVMALCAKLLLLPRRYGSFSHADFYYPSYRLHYPDLAVPAAILDQLEPAGPQPWNPSASTSLPTATSWRSGGEIALDLWTTAQALGQAGTWKTNRGGSLAKSMQNKLQKLFTWPAQEPLLPPNPESLYYEILRGLGGGPGGGRSGLPQSRQG